METTMTTQTAEAEGFTRSPAELQYADVRERFQTLARQNNLLARDIATFTIARVLLNQLDLEEDSEIERRALTKLQKAFTPITNAKKLQNGRRRWDTLTTHLYNIEVGNFGNIAFTDELQGQMRSLAKQLVIELRATRKGS